jgi:hypothetical protein
MTFKTEQFFKNNELDVKSTVQMIMQYPNNTEEIVRYIASKIKQYAEYEVEMKILKKEYDQSVMELYAKYMGEEKDLKTENKSV